MPRTLRRLALLALVAASAAAGEAGVFFKLDGKPLYFETDVGGTEKEKQAFLLRFAKPIQDTAEFFIHVYQLKPTAFDDFVVANNAAEWERPIRVRIFATFAAFLQDYQKRYETKSIPAAFFGINRPKDEYGKYVGKWQREVATYDEGLTDEQVLRYLYHEIGHLFMHTFIVYNVEVPSWVEEGTAELFEYRKNNGTHPEQERDQRVGWLVEMANEGSTIPWKEFINVRNLDNLDFTWKDPLRSTIQYAQAWSVCEFMIDPRVPARAAAYTRMLGTFKDAAHVARDKYALYGVQEDLFRKAYGADLIAVEGKWKESLHKNYEAELPKKPVLRYYRGEWHLMRANLAKDGKSRDAELDKAKAIFDEAVAATPELPEAYVGLGRVALEKGDADEANKQFAKAIETGTDNFEALLYGGLAKIRDGKAGEAVDALTKAVAQRPSHFEANLFLGEALAISKQDADQALEHLKRIMDVRPDWTSHVAIYAAIVDDQRGAFDQANIMLLKAGSSNPNDPMIQIMRGIVQAEANDVDDATAIFTGLQAQLPVAGVLLQRLKAKQPLPKLGFTTSGHPTLIDGEPEEAKPTGAKDAKGAKPADAKDAKGGDAPAKDLDAQAKDLFGDDAGKDAKDKDAKEPAKP